jgi:hypothetical protein
MKQIAYVLVAILMCGCASSKIAYKTPKLEQIPLNKSSSNGVVYLATPSLPDNPRTVDDIVAVSAYSAFDQAFLSAIGRSKDFDSVYKCMGSQNTKEPTLTVDIKAEPSPNFISVMLFIGTLGIVPAYQEIDYTVNCTLKTGGRNYSYMFRETSSTWTGLLILGKLSEKDAKETQKEIFENISRNLINNLRSEGVVQAN